MLDQTFSATNFRQIFDEENRKGHDIASEFFPTLNRLSNLIKIRGRLIRIHKQNKIKLSVEQYNTRLQILRTRLDDAKERKSQRIDKLLEGISADVRKKSFSIKLQTSITHGVKITYQVPDDPQSFFAIKQLQKNFYKIYKVKQANRHQIVDQISRLLDSNYEFKIYRTDISTFYESIDRKKILDRLEADQLLSPTSKKFLRQIFREYERISGSAVGIPRGVGVSAYLAEYYLRPLDRAISGNEGTVYYSRYVDDIVIVIARHPKLNAIESSKNLLRNSLQSLSLSENITKVTEIDIKEGLDESFDYLGYEFRFIHKNLKVDITDSKLNRIERRIDAAFDKYDIENSKNSKRAYRNLVNRIKFLTGNTRLLNNKSQALVGIYYSNSHINQSSKLKILDAYLSKKIKFLKRKSLRNRLKPLKFTSGYNERRFHRFSIKQLETIVKGWSNV